MKLVVHRSRRAEKSVPLTKSHFYARNYLFAQSVSWSWDWSSKNLSKNPTATQSFHVLFSRWRFWWKHDYVKSVQNLSGGRTSKTRQNWGVIFSLFGCTANHFYLLSTLCLRGAYNGTAQDDIAIQMRSLSVKNTLFRTHNMLFSQRHK